jgi:hypothetical protein
MRRLRAQFNEGRACDAVIRYLERRFGAVRTCVQLPEREHLEVPIEVAFELAGTAFAMEHTGIEPFEGHTQLQATGDAGIRPLSESLLGKLPPTDDFELHVPAGVFSHLGRQRLQEVHRLIADWIIEVSPTLPAAPIGRFNPTVAVTIPGVPFKVKLYRSTGFVRPGPPANCERC